MRTQLHHLVAEKAHTHPAAPAVTFKDSTTTYGRLWPQITAVARGIQRLGTKRGERVAIFLEKRLETIATIFGVSLAGCVFVPVNPVLRPKQVSYILGNCGVRVLVTTPERIDALRDELKGCTELQHVVLCGSGLTSTGRDAWRMVAWQEFAGDIIPLVGMEHGRVDQDIAAIFYTSGSTGKPKGVILSHRNLLVGAESVSHYLGNTNDDVILAALPLSFDAGFSQITTAFHIGAHVILHNYLLPDDAIRLCAKHAVTGLTGVPPLWIQLAERNWPTATTMHLRYFANTGGRMPRATLDRLRAILPHARPFLMYGLTEAFRSTYLDPAEVDRRPDSIGKAIPNAEILVVRPDGSPCDPGEPGELVHRGPLVSLGYWKDPEKTAERFRPAPAREVGLCLTEIAVWSGDVVVRDADGFLYFVGRNDEMIKTSGYRVSPAEIEEVVYDTGLVCDAVAVGVEDPRLGQHIVLFVSPANGRELDASVLLATLKKQLPLYMVPSKIIIRPALPRSPNGKFDRSLLRQEFVQ